MYMTASNLTPIVVEIINLRINGIPLDQIKEKLLNQGVSSGEDFDKAAEVLQHYLFFIRQTWERKGLGSEVPEEFVNSILANTLMLYKKQASSLRMCMEWCAMQQIAKEAENKR
jgi:hypothetical protein